jgi:hypothetical protein
MFYSPEEPPAKRSHLHEQIDSLDVTSKISSIVARFDLAIDVINGSRRSKRPPPTPRNG